MFALRRISGWITPMVVANRQILPITAWSASDGVPVGPVSLTISVAPMHACHQADGKFCNRGL
jgi:hypothetical protein